MKIETDNFLFITNANINTCDGWEESSPGVFKFKGVINGRKI